MPADACADAGTIAENTQNFGCAGAKPPASTGAAGGRQGAALAAPRHLGTSAPRHLGTSAPPEGPGVATPGRAQARNGRRAGLIFRVKCAQRIPEKQPGSRRLSG